MRDTTLAFLTALVLAACSSPYARLEPPPGRYFHHSGRGPCDTFVIGIERDVSGLCETGGTIESGFFEPPHVVCAGGLRFGLTPTLDGFALTRAGQVHAFVFPNREACERSLPEVVEPTL